MPHCARSDLAAPIEGANAGQEIAERKDALHPRWLEAERIRDLVHAAPRFDQRDERFSLAHLVGLNLREIFEHRGFERIDIVTLVDNGARVGFTASLV